MDIENVNHQSTAEYNQNNENDINNENDNNDKGEVNFQIISYPGKFFACIGDFENYAKDDNPSNLLLNSSRNSSKLGCWKGEIVLQLHGH